MLFLQGVKIETFSVFHQYFDFQELYDLLRSEDSYLFYEFCRYNLKPSKMLTILPKVLGINKTNGELNPSAGIARLIDDPRLCLEEEVITGVALCRKCESEAGSDQMLVMIDSVDKLTDGFFPFFQAPCCAWDPQRYNIKECKSPAWSDLRESVKQAVCELTENGQRKFTLEAVLELYLYFLLHALAAVLPDTPESMEVIRKDLDRMCPVSSAAKRQQSSFVLQPDASGKAEMPLSYYKGITNRAETLSVVEFKNSSEKPITVQVKDTVLTRVIGAERGIYALRKGNQIVSFLPRFRLQDQVSSFYCDGRLYHECNGKREEVKTSIKRPVLWVRNDEYGTFILDQSGKIDEEAAWPNSVPEKPIVMVDAHALDYCMLFSDGTTESAIYKHNWNQASVISVHLGMNSAIAINERRKAILDNGEIIEGISPMDAKTYDKHYICLDEKGRIKTDSGLSEEKSVYAIGICRLGYMLAYRDCVCLYDYRNQLYKKWNIAGVTEMEADDSSFAYYDGVSGEVKKQPI